MTFTEPQFEIDHISGIPRLRLRLHTQSGSPGLTDAILDQLIQALESVQNVRLITLEGIAESFCTGMDLAYVVSLQENQTIHNPMTLGFFQKYRKLLDTIQCAPFPVIALVDGEALGGGFGLAAAADLVIASSRARFSFPELLMGLIPASTFGPIIQRLGFAKARLLALSSNSLSASEAYQLGLVDEITDDFNACMGRYARRFGRVDERALAAMKGLVQTHFTISDLYGSDAIQILTDLLATTETNTRIQRFLAGETPWRDVLP